MRIKEVIEMLSSYSKDKEIKVVNELLEEEAFLKFIEENSNISIFIPNSDKKLELAIVIDNDLIFF